MRNFSLVQASFAALTAVCTIAQPLHADQFYSGKKLTVLVGFGAGGGYDTNARLVARHLGDHIPGNPVIVIQNMPGAGSMTVAHNIYNVAPKDGTVLGVFSLSVALEPLFASPQILGA